MWEDKEIQLIFNPGKGEVPLRTITAVRGDRIGAMPKATRRGYVFTGWYTVPQSESEPDSALRVTPERIADDSLDSETVLYAHWAKPSKAQKKKTALATQRRAVAAMAIAAVLLVVTLVIVNIIVDIYEYPDKDGEIYTIRKKDGEYLLWKDGEVCDRGRDGSVEYFMTKLGTQVIVDPDTGEYEIYAVVDTGGTELVGTSQRVLMFKQLTYDRSSTNDLSTVLKRIEVHNEYGTMVFNRKSAQNRFEIEGHEDTAFSDQLFAQLSVGCAYTLSTQRLENPVRLADGSLDLCEYGLAPETRTRVGEDGTEETYEYTPAWYTLTTMTDETYTVTLGDETVTGGGYYAMKEGWDTIYILSSVNIRDAVLQPIETLTTPTVVSPMSMNSYYDVENFMYRSNIDYMGLYLALASELTGYDFSTVEWPEDEDAELPAEVLEKLEEAQEQIDAMEPEEYSKLYEKLLVEHSELITAFTFVDTAERSNTLYAHTPYTMSSDYMAGYLPNSNNISTVLYQLYSLAPTATVVLGPTADELAEYGLDQPAHVISYIYHQAVTDEDGSTSYIDMPNYVQFSAKSEDGLYYAYSPYYDMIVSIDPSQVPYLEWNEIDWYEQEYFQANIAFVYKIILESDTLDAPIVFDLDNSLSNQTNGINSDNILISVNGQPIDYSLTVTSVSGKQETKDERYNYSKFFQSLLTASLEDTADLTEEEMAEHRQRPDGECLLKMTILMDDGKGNTRYVVYRFYPYSARRSYLTVEVLSSPEDTPDPTRAQGKFDVLTTFCDKLLSDAQRFIDGVEVVPNSKN